VLQASEWLRSRGIEARDAVLLVPFAQHLSPARRAWARHGGWMPRIETTHTLAATLGPPAVAGEGQPSFDFGTDRLLAARLLRADGWTRREPAAFDEAVSAVVKTAHALARASAAVLPAMRPAYWQLGRQLLARSEGPDRIERGLANLALEWAAQAAPRSTDRLYSFRPGAWLALQCGGPDALVERVFSAADESIPCAIIDGDAAVPRLLSNSLSLGACDGFEDEAQFAAAQVLADLQRGLAPVALVAQDRVLVRRVRALLERQHVPLVDETGWKLSTTHAAAQLMGLLRAASPIAPTDVLLEWLKSPGAPGDQAGQLELEATCRRKAWSRVTAIDEAQLPANAAAAWASARAALQILQAPKRQSLADWWLGLAAALQAAGQWDALAADEAGAQVLRSLHLSPPGGSAQASQTLMALDDFGAWVDDALEDASFVPVAPADIPGVVITSLGHVMMRPFGAIVFPGADERHLGAGVDLLPLLSDAQAVALGLPNASQRREAESLAFAHAVSGVPVSLFYRHSDGNEPLSPSPLVERLALRLRRAGRGFAAWVDPRPARATPLAPVYLPAPAAAALLPSRLSASACEALRACPYRFHALHMLKLREADELGDEVEKRDYGTWLHAVLMAFHETRPGPDSPAVETLRLLDIARAQKALHGLDDADFLPFEAAFADLAPRYIDWLHRRDQSGARWWQGEQARELQPEGWQGITLHGRIDRADHVKGEAGPEVELIDYKTGSIEALRQQVKVPLEDTQLAFYAALMAPGAGAPLQAMYLSLGREIKGVPHPDVEHSAQSLIEGLGDELARVQAGHGLPALGEGRVCDYCEARGLCRRDHWTRPPP
jgi:ATP-dependent helicase/nuclease subunit B